jgi:hypothetical protein
MNQHYQPHTGSTGLLHLPGIPNACLQRFYEPSECSELSVKELGTRYVVIGYHRATDQCVILCSCKAKRGAEIALRRMRFAISDHALVAAMGAAL